MTIFRQYSGHIAHRRKNDIFLQPNWMIYSICQLTTINSLLDQASLPKNRKGTRLDRPEPRRVPLGPVLPSERPLLLLFVVPAGGRGRAASALGAPRHRLAAEPERHMLGIARLHVPPPASLHLLDAVLLELGLVHVAELEAPLVGPEAGVGGRQVAARLLGELVELDGEAGEAVVVGGVLGHGAHAPDRLGRVVRAAEERLVPLAEDLALDHVLGRDDVAEETRSSAKSLLDLKVHGFSQTGEDFYLKSSSSNDYSFFRVA